MIRKSKLFKFSCICALVLSISGTSAYAYSRFSGSWPSSYVYYSIDSDVPDSYVAPIEDAAAMWNDNTDINLSRNDSSDINIYAGNWGSVDWDGLSLMNGGQTATYFKQTYSYGYLYINEAYVDNYTDLQKS